MAHDDLGERTEQPTPRRRAEARNQGRVPRSIDLNSAAHLLAAAAILYLLGHSLAHSLGEFMHRSLSSTPSLGMPVDSLVVQSTQTASWTLRVLLPLLLASAAAALAINLLQVGFLFTFEPLVPNLDRVNPLEGAKRILSMHSLARLTAATVKIGIVAAVAFWFVSARLPHVLRLSNMDVPAIGDFLARSILHMAALLSASLLIPALVDFAFQKWKHEHDLKMTRQEVREEQHNLNRKPPSDPHRPAHRNSTKPSELLRVGEVGQT